MKKYLTSVRVYAIGFVLLSTMIIAHELGHALTALMLGEKIISFNLGFGPEVWSTTMLGTKVAFRAIFLGGYVMLPEIFTIPSYKALLIFLAGGVVNILFGIILLSILKKRKTFKELLETPVVIVKAVINTVNILYASNNLTQAIALRINSRKQNSSINRQSDDIKIVSIKNSAVESDNAKSKITSKSNKLPKITTVKTIDEDEEERFVLSINPFPIMKELGTGSINRMVETFAIISIFIGFLNLMPLPLFDGSRYVLLFLRIFTGQSAAEIALAIYAMFFLTLAVFSAIFNALANRIRPAIKSQSSSSAKNIDEEISRFLTSVVLDLYNLTPADLSFDERYRLTSEQFPGHMSSILQQNNMEVTESMTQSMKIFVNSIRTKIFEQVKQNN